MLKTLPWDEIKDVTMIRYGASIIDLSDYKVITNSDWRNKPLGGMWTSPKGSSYGWDRWCQDNDFMVHTLDEWLELQFLPGAQVYKIDSLEDLKALPMTIQNPILPQLLGPRIDYEKLAREGLSAIWLTERGERTTRFGSMTAHAPTLYGWDCESILILNCETIKVKN